LIKKALPLWPSPFYLKLKTFTLFIARNVWRKRPLVPFLLTIKLSACLERKWSKRTLEPVLIFKFLNLAQVFACSNIYCNAKKPYYFA